MLEKLRKNKWDVYVALPLKGLKKNKDAFITFCFTEERKILGKWK